MCRLNIKIIDCLHINYDYICIINISSIKNIEKENGVPIRNLLMTIMVKYCIIKLYVPNYKINSHLFFFLNLTAYVWTFLNVFFFFKKKKISTYLL